MAVTSPSDPRGTGPYGSVRDLPTYREMSLTAQGLKVLTLFVARDQRQRIRDAEREMEHLADVVDGFYAMLGERNWIFHEQLSVSKIEAILDEVSDPERAEARLIDLYRDTEVTKFWLLRLRHHEGLRARMRQIERAREHYDAGQFDSCTLQLVAVMDGFVNDLEPGVRKGLAAREPDEMVAWDSVVGHHQGLTHVLKTFGQSKKKRVDKEVFEVYRHGIVHGTVVNFDNIVVATKAWNMLFAVADWAEATNKAARPVEPKQTWGDAWSALKQLADRRQAKKQFMPSTTSVTDPDFAQDELVCRANEFLGAWERGRWGQVAEFRPRSPWKPTRTAGDVARLTKEAFGLYAISDWRITKVSRDVLGGAEIYGSATVNGVAQEMRFRMVAETPDGDVVLPGDEDATWRLGIWAPHVFFTTST